MRTTPLRSLVLCSALLISSTLARPSRRDADFGSVRIHNDKNYNNISPNQPEKYFHEARFDVHYDGRFTDGRLPYEHHRSSLVLLAQTCLTTLADIGVETWVMHGSLIGWYWNRRILPWDSDIDLQISEKSIDHLAQYYNMSTHRFKVGNSSLRRNYLLEINAHYSNSSLQDKTNVIDARWIDTDTGLFLDLTVLRHNKTAQAEGIDGAMFCKDGHTYKYDDIYPLRDTTFEGVPAKVPSKYSQVIIEEYHETAITSVWHEGHRFDRVKQEWLPFLDMHQENGRIPQSSFVAKLDQAALELNGGMPLAKETYSLDNAYVAAQPG